VEYKNSAAKNSEKPGMGYDIPSPSRFLERIPIDAKSTDGIFGALGWR
jgi:hypothetical protein